MQTILIWLPLSRRRKPDIDVQLGGLHHLSLRTPVAGWLYQLYTYNSASKLHVVCRNLCTAIHFSNYISSLASGPNLCLLWVLGMLAASAPRISGAVMDVQHGRNARKTSVFQQP